MGVQRVCSFQKTRLVTVGSTPKSLSFLSFRHALSTKADSDQPENNQTNKF